MQQTVVGVFDSLGAAQKAAADLAAKGVPVQRVHVSEQAASAVGSTGSTANAVQSEDDGVLSHIKHFFEGLFGEEDHAPHYAEAVRRGGAIVKVDVEGDSDLAKVTEALDDAGAVDIEERANQWREQGWNASSAAAGATAAASAKAVSTAATERSATASALDTGASRVIPVLKEELEVGKRTVGTGAVRVYARTVETPVNETVALRSEHADIERRPVDRPATAADLAALKDRTIEVVETAEKAVVSKTARVVEEVSVGKHVETHEEKIADSVRHTEVKVERTGADTFAKYDQGFRSDFQTRFGATGGSYSDYEPAYRYGHELQGDPRYKGRQWDEIEHHARADWESRNSGTAWEKVKAAVRHAWERVTD